MPRPNCVDLHWRRQSELARLGQLYPAFQAIGGDSHIDSAVLPREIGVRIAYELATTSATTDGSLKLTYPAADPGSDILALSNTYRSRVLTVGTAVSVNVQYFDIITPSTDCNSAYQDPDMPVVLPASPTINNVPFTDDVVLGVDAKQPIVVSWTPDGAPAGLPVVTQLNLISANKVVRYFLTVDNKVEIDPALLESNTPYRIHLVPTTGLFPNAATGDLRTVAFPNARGVWMSGLFRIVKSS